MHRFLSALVCALLLPAAAQAQFRVPVGWVLVGQDQVAHQATGHSCPLHVGQFELYAMHNQAGQALCLYKTPCTTCDETTLKASFGLLPKSSKSPMKDFLKLTSQGAARIADPLLMGASEAGRLSVTGKDKTIEATLWVMPMPNGTRVVSVMGAPESRDEGTAFAKVALETKMGPPSR